MAKGKWKTNYLGREGLVQSSDSPDYSFIYSTSTVKDEKYNIGDRVVLPDGRVFRYGKSAAALNNDLACAFAEDEVCTYSTVSVAGAVGDKKVTITAVAVDSSAHAILTEDELRGGYVIIYHTGGGGYTQFRGIIGNEAAAASAVITISLDAPLDHATIAASTGIEVFYNPYASLQLSATLGNGASKAGKPAVHVTAASMYFWVQTWGPCWIAPRSTFATGYNRGAYFAADGSIQPEIATGSLAATDSTQYAGFLINEGYTTGPMLMLQVCP